MRLKRNYETKVLKLLNLFPVVALLGIRQCGKTTLARSLKPDWRYVDLESAANFDLVSGDPGLFLTQNPNKVIFDEAQLLPELFSELRHAIDNQRDLKGRFIITGSSSPALLRKISESLAGRVALIRISPLKCNELYETNTSALYEVFLTGDTEQFSSTHPVHTHAQVLEHWLEGGFPEPRLATEEYFSDLWYDNYLASYIDRDIAPLFPGLNRVRYRRFIGLLANLSATIINQSDIARAIEVSAPTVKEYFEIAAGTFIWRSLSSFERNVVKAVSKMPRGLLVDSGLRHQLIKLGSLEQLQIHPQMGVSFESFVIEEILRGLEASMLTGWSAHYYRTRAKSEIDLIIDSKIGAIPIEIKYSSTLRSVNLRTIKDFIKTHNSPFGLLINNGDRIERIGDKLFQIPVRCL